MRFFAVKATVEQLIKFAEKGYKNLSIAWVPLNLIAGSLHAEVAILISETRDLRIRDPALAAAVVSMGLERVGELFKLSEKTGGEEWLIFSNYEPPFEKISFRPSREDILKHFKIQKLLETLKRRFAEDEALQLAVVETLVIKYIDRPWLGSSSSLTSTGKRN